MTHALESHTYDKLIPVFRTTANGINKNYMYIIMMMVIIVTITTRKQAVVSTCRPTPAMAAGSTAAYWYMEYGTWSLASV